MRIRFQFWAGITVMFLLMGTAASAVDWLPLDDSNGCTFYRMGSDRTIQVTGFRAEGFFRDGLAMVRSKTDYSVGFIDTTGTFVIPPEYQLVSGCRFSHGFASVKRKGGETMGCIDRTGRWVIPDTFAYIGLFDELGTATFRTRDSKLSGFIDTSGRVLVVPSFTSLWSYDGDFAKGKMPVGISWKGKNVVIDRNAKVVLTTEMAIGLPGDGLIAVGHPTTDTAIVSCTFYQLGDTAFTPVLENVQCLKKDIAQIRISNGRTAFPGMVDGEMRWGFLSVTGDTIVKPKYKFFTRFSQSRAFGCTIDATGQMIYECIGLDGQVVFDKPLGYTITFVNQVFEEISQPFRDGVACVRLLPDGSEKDFDAWIDREGNVVAGAR